MSLDPNEHSEEPIAKFESMLKTDEVYFFDAEDFEDIIHHYLNHGKISLAKKALKFGLEQHPNSIELLLLKVEIYVFENCLTEATTLLEELELLDGTNVELFIQKANILSKQDCHIEAIKSLEKALDISPDHIDIYALLGMEYLFLDDFLSAKKCFMKCVEFDLEDYASLYNVVYCFDFLEDYDGAIHYLNQYLEKNPYCEVAWHQLGKIYSEKELYKEALTSFDFAIYSDDRFIGAYYEKGMVLEKLGRFNEAIENYETTIQLEDPTSHAYLRLGRCHEELGNNDLAQSYYYQTVHEDPLLDKGWLAITNFYYKNKDYNKAAFYINKAINIDAENPLYWKKCAQINTALFKYYEADYAYQQAVEYGNYELDTWISWAEVMFLLNDLNASIDILVQALEFYPESAEVHYFLAAIYHETTDLFKAEKHLKRGLKINKESLFQISSSLKKTLTTNWAKNIISKY
jgi:tetratricopeptide (TPR) repeat protein